MTFNFEFESKKRLEFDYEALIRKVVISCLDYVKCPFEAEVSILLTDDEEIKQINQEFRDIDRPTDVLSFPAIDYGLPGDFSGLAEDTVGYFNPESGELILGDIVISVERALVQAQEYGHTAEREIAFLTAHSMFHLFGYDHMEDEERMIMEEKQRSVLDQLQISR